MKYFVRLLGLVALAAVGVVASPGCAAMEHGELLNPKTGPGTPYPCPRADDVYCEQIEGHASCCYSGEVCKPARCDEAPYNGNRDFIGSARGSGSHPRVRVVR